ncbi:FadR/GntR family transcriptional regulator [Nocardia jiangxiensis]|uniref:FadR/GntR family transcriptional regulator n=1 Tax=Nocardia jiangxiensis TaxID=282685 RepID=A0ABW6SCI7_9NOCA|nr:GntR family transcriptional regulator [Nocardia jiangxiensis]
MTQPGAKLYRGRVADQIAADLRRQILDGELADGARLPSERELAAHYDVSAPTVREAIRVLTVMGLLHTRNGSRTTVTANGDSLLRMSIASVVQFDKMRPGDVLGLLGVLNSYAAELAVEYATDDDIAALRAAAERTADTSEVRLSAAALREFFVALSVASHNALLSALCKALSEIQIGLAVELSGGESGSWGSVAGAMYKARIAIVDALARRDPATPDLVREYHQNVVKRTRNLPRAKQISKTDPGLTQLLATWLGTNISPDAAPDSHH